MSAIREKPPPFAPGLAQVDIQLHISTQVNITPFVARQKVNLLMLDQVGNLLHGGEPELLVPSGSYWRVPVLLSTPSRGLAGQFRAVRVDVQTGEVLADDKLLKDIAEHARRLLTGSPSGTNGGRWLSSSLCGHGSGLLAAPVDQRRVARLLDTQEFGTVAPRIHRLADWGYATTYQNGSVATLRKLLAADISPIVFVWTGNLPYWSINTPHAVVLIGLDEEQVLVNDPALSVAPPKHSAGRFSPSVGRVR